MKMYCPSCGNYINDDSKFCPACGTQLDSTISKNPSQNSYNSNQEKTTYTSYSNTSTSNNTNYNASPKSRTVAAILAYFLGFVGGQLFYTGRIGGGIVSILFCWTGIPALIGFIEFIVILCGKFTDSDGRVISNW